MAEQDTNQQSTDDQFEQLRLAIDTETNRLADVLEQKAAGIGNRLGDKETASLKQWMADHAARLRQLAADGSDPVPGTPATPDLPPAPTGTEGERGEEPGTPEAADAAGDSNPAQAGRP